MFDTNLAEQDYAFLYWPDATGHFAKDEHLLCVTDFHLLLSCLDVEQRL